MCDYVIYMLYQFANSLEKENINSVLLKIITKWQQPEKSIRAQTLSNLPAYSTCLSKCL